ncbi:MAG: hypothetical protein WA876_07610 [Candidatus Acidiferrales bacterium]
MLKIFGLLTALTLFASTYSRRQSPPSAEAIPSYPNSPDGLVAMMNDMLGFAKRGNVVAIEKYSQSFVLPHPEAWFKTEFGDENCRAKHMAADDCLGPRLALTYASTAKMLPISLPKTLNVLLEENLTNFEAVDYSQPCAAPQYIIPARKLVGDLGTTPILSRVLSGLIQHREPVYIVWSYNKKAETTLAFFVYSDGAFRYIGMPHPASLEEFARKAEIPQPSELTNEIATATPVLADQALIQRTVVLHVIIGADGKARKISYVRGPEDMKDSAIQTVEQRQFGRQSLGGHAIQIDTCINVIPRR